MILLQLIQVPVPMILFWLEMIFFQVDMIMFMFTPSWGKCSHGYIYARQGKNPINGIVQLYFKKNEIKINVNFKNVNKLKINIIS